MNWIRISTGIRNDPSIGLIADLCKVDVEHAVGLVVALLCELPKHASDGDVNAVPDRMLEQWAGWRRKRGVFAAAFRDHLCSDGVVRSWEKHNGAALRKAEQDIQRKRERRADGARTALDRRTVGAVDETRRDVTNNKEKTDRSEQLTDSAELDRKPSVDQSVDHAALDAKFGGERPPTPPPPVPDTAYRVQLDELHAAALPHEKLALDSLVAGHPQPYALVLELHALASGLHMIRGNTTGRTADVADVMRAVAEMAANGDRWSVKLFRGYLRRIADRPPEPASADDRASAKLAAEIVKRAPAPLTRGERTADGTIVPVPLEADDTPEAKEARRVAREAAMAAFRAGQRRAVEIDHAHGATQGEAA